MKSILQSIALLSAAVLIAGCDSSSGGGSAGVVTPPAPQVSATGSGTKGIIVGGTVTVTDAAGVQIGQSVTGADGTYDIAYDQSTAITNPLTITITGGQTACDFNNDGTANDCPTGNPAPNDFVAFGEFYDLPATFALRSLAPAAAAGGVSHATPLSEVALQAALAKAGVTSPGDLTTAQATEANLALSGLIEAITGISLEGIDITAIQPADLTVTAGSTASNAQFALAGASGAFIGAQGAGESLTATIARLAALITIDANGNVTGTGTNLGQLVSAIARGLAVAANASGNDNLVQAATNASNLATVYTNLGAATVTVPPLAIPGSTVAGVATKTFVTRLATVVGEVTTATGAQGSGEDGSVGATEAFFSELDAVARLSSDNATTALNRLSDKILVASRTVVAGTDVVNGVETEEGADDGVTFTLSIDADGVRTLSNVSSTWPLMAAAANKVTITASDDTANTAGVAVASTATDSASAGDFSLTGVTMTTLDAAGTATAQTFTGNISNAVTAATETTEATDTFAFDGTIAGSSTGTGSTLAIDLDITADPRNPTSASTRGTYTAVFTFDAADDAVDLTLSLSGTIGSSLQSFTVLTAANIGINGTVTRTGATDVNTLSDGNATLTLTVTDGSVVADANGVIGTFTEGTGDTATQTGTLDNNGVVTFTDGSILLLPSIIFIPDN